jgi:hypothetical protein
MIDWSQPIYSNGRRMGPSPDPMGLSSMNFTCLMFEDDPAQARWYYNLDGTPFARNPHPISNRQDIHTLDWLEMQEAEAIESIPGWGAFS